MKIKLREIRGHGVLDEERVVIRVLAQTNIGAYVLCRGSYIAADQVSTDISHPFWFPDTEVSERDFVVLFTKSGTNTSYRNKSGTVTHVFHLGKKLPIWADASHAVILFETANWEAGRASGEP